VKSTVLSMPSRRIVVTEDISVDCKMEKVNAFVLYRAFIRDILRADSRELKGLLFQLPIIHALFFVCLLYAFCTFTPTPARGQPATIKDDSHVFQLAGGKTTHGSSVRSDFDVLNAKAEICNWYGEAAGAASISMDDSFPSCRQVLNENGFKGTYYLSGTDKFTVADWDMWRAIRAEGHEIGCHTVSHCSCHILDAAALNYEFSTNKKDIMSNLGLREEEILSFAWPRGDASSGSKVIANEYFLCARGYHVNELEDGDPNDLMYLKCLNTPHYHAPAYDPPSYFEMADNAERLGKWVHFVFHNECMDDGAISYLATKNLWVAPVGTVVKYIKERQNSSITNIENTNSKFAVALTCSLKPDIFNQELTMKVCVDPNNMGLVLVNGINTPFTPQADHILLNIRPSGTDTVEVLSKDLVEQVNPELQKPSQTQTSTRSGQSQIMVAGNGAVINIWISGPTRLDNMRNHQIKYLFVDVGDTNRDGKIETPITDMTRFLQMIKSYEKQHAYDFIILPYSEINTFRCKLDRQFRDNFVTDYKGLITSGFDGIYVDVEPVRISLKEDYLEFLNELSAVCPKPLILAVYAGSMPDFESDEKEISDWQWSRSLYRDVSELVDLVVIPGYDFNLRSKRDYKESISKQIYLLSSEQFGCHFMFAAPTHKREPETIDNALTAYRLEVSRRPRHQFIGVCVFAEWTTTPEEWSVFESYK